ncbi:MAG: formate/nitrite transporter family protein [Clostridia bacterium]|nr:formate/nitrite transporter family protein [Clostridia bacterium]
MVRKYLTSGILSGIVIGIGGAVYLACDSRYVGALLFTTGLLCICVLGFSLYTGKIGFMVVRHEKEDYAELFLGLLGNFIGASLTGYAIAAATPARMERALEICTAKLEIPFISVFILALFCGILVYLAVVIFREKQNVLGIFFCIPTFILAGFEHSIADMFYFAASGIVSQRAFLFVLVVILGNTAGGMLVPALRLLMSGVRQHV